MTIKAIVDDIREILNAVSDDSDIQDEWLIHKINGYRAIFLKEKIDVDVMLPDSFFLPYPVMKTEKVTTSDDPSITYSSGTLSRARVPKYLDLPEDQGIKIMSASGAVNYQKASVSMLAFKSFIQEYIPPLYGYYAMMGEFVYVYPLTHKIMVRIIPEDPMDVPYYDGEAYRERLITDPYPMDIITSQRAILALLQAEMKIKISTIADIVNDSQDQFKVLNNEQLSRRNQ